MFWWKTVKLEWHGLKIICIGYASAKGASKLFLDMLIGR